MTSIAQQGGKPISTSCSVASSVPSWALMARAKCQMLVRTRQESAVLQNERMWWDTESPNAEVRPRPSIGATDLGLSPGRPPHFL